MNQARRTLALIARGAVPIVVVLLLAGACRGGAPQGDAPARSPTPDAAAASSVAPVPSSGCARSAVPAGAQVETLDVNGVQRTYRRFVPDGAAGALPVVVNLHGILSNVDQQVAFTGFETLAADEHFIVLTPQGAGNPPGWSLAAGAANSDIAFIDAMLDAVESAACVDTARVYATGLSMGGMMSSLLACYEPGRFAAVGLVSGIVHPDGCSTSRAVPIVVFWGKQDVVLPYCGGVGPVISALLSGTPIAGLPPPACPPADFLGFPPVEEVVGDWAATDGCSSEPASSPAAEHVELRAYGGCKNDATVEFYVIADGSHAWPGSAVMAAIGASPAGAIIGHTNDEIDASTLIWRFFQRYALPR